MALQNYKVEQEDGTETFYQFDPEDDLGKAQLRALNDAAKDDNSPVKSVAKGDPKPFNAKS
jgi:hypothetical protein